MAVRFVCAIGITGNQADAKEVVQDALWTVVRMIGTSTGASASSSWVYSVVANVANADTGGWGCCNFSHHEPKTPTAKVKPKTEYAFRPITSSKADHVWTTFYPVLDN